MKKANKSLQSNKLSKMFVFNTLKIDAIKLLSTFVLFYKTGPRNS